MGDRECGCSGWSWANRTRPGGGGPVPVEGSEFLLDVDTVVYALGTTANPIIAQTTPGLTVQQMGLHRNR